MVASRPGLGDVHGTGKGTARRHRSRFRQYLPSVCPVRLACSPYRFLHFCLPCFPGFLLRPDPPADMPPRDHPPPSGHPSALALRALGSRGDTPRQPGLSLLRQRLSILTFHIFSGMQERVFPRVAILPALNQLEPTCNPFVRPPVQGSPLHPAAPQRQRIPRFGAVAVHSVLF